MSEEIVKAWHFLPNDRRLRWDSKKVVESGKAYVQTWPYNGFDRPTLCEAGMHASRRPLDALNYATGNIICRVLLRGRIVEDPDKLVADERGVLWMADAEQALRDFARWCARSVLHLWDAPKIVKQYLATGDESIRAAAWAAARAAAGAAAGDAAGEAQNLELERMLLTLEVKHAAKS